MILQIGSVVAAVPPTVGGGAIGAGYTVCMHEKGPQEPPEHTSEHVKYQTFLGVCPQTLLTHPFCGAPVFIFALPPPQSSR